MIHFLTLFLGLLTGPQNISIAVSSPDVASVELRLDGESCGIDYDAPWTLAARGESPDYGRLGDLPW